MEKVIGIYKITSPVGKIYIGQSVNILKRKRNYKCSLAKKQTRLHRSILKYGWEYHSFEIIHTCGKEKLDELEKYYIKKYNTLNTNHGLNLKDGGANGLCSIETRKRLSESHMGNKPSLKTREKQSALWDNKSLVTYKLLSPSNELVEFKNVRSFARKHCLDKTCVMLLLNGKMNYTKGWKRVDSYYYSFLSPDGELHDKIYSLKEFSEKQGLNMKGFSKLHKGNLKSYYNWKRA